MLILPKHLATRLSETYPNSKLVSCLMVYNHRRHHEGFLIELTDETYPSRWCYIADNCTVPVDLTGPHGL